MDNEKKMRFLVVDTTGFIKNIQFQNIAENVLTTPSVTREITSKSQLRRLVVLPYDLDLKEPFPDSIKHVSEFAKKTGDYASLSATDIQVIALTYQLEKEHVGTEHLRQEPLKRVVADGSIPCQQFKDIAGFYIPKGEELDPSDPTQEVEGNINLKLTEAEEELVENENEIEEEPEANDEEAETHNVEEVENNGEEEENEDEETEFWDGEEGDDDDEEGWITPGNLKQMREKIISEVEETVTSVVGCLTTDFAMQNVLKQMGLNVVSFDGRVIKELRTFILRCHACFKTTSVMNKVFCPNCGNKTLKKVAVSTNPDGTQQIHINFRKPLTARGKRYSLPTPKGGKHATNPILCEDQPMPQQKGTRLSRLKNNPLDDDYIAGFSPFVTRDVTSRSALLGIRPNAQVKQWMRRNPNESTKPGGRKRK